MKKILIVSMFLSLLSGITANAVTNYTNDDNRETMVRQQYNERANANREIWNQTISSYENSYNDSMKKYWDEYTAAYQRQKKINH